MFACCGGSIGALVFELIEGRLLRVLAASELEQLSEVREAYKSAHACEVVHGDRDWANVVVCRDGAVFH